MFVTHSELIKKRNSYERVYCSLIVAILLIGRFTYSEIQQSNLMAQQVDDYVRQNYQLLTQIEKIA